MRGTLAATVMMAVAVAQAAAEPDVWFARVAPVMTGAERDAYAALKTGAEREAFQNSFWNDKAMTAEEYFDRISYVDARFGSGKEGSGANTDQGRVYLALGPPTNVSQLPSSRLFVPVEIWRYDHVPGVTVSSEIQLLFYQARTAGFMKLYSPQLQTIRVLIINNAGTRGVLPVNDIVNADDLLNRVRLSPAELEVVDAAMGVARGIKGSGNDELLAQVANPSLMVRRRNVAHERVESRVYTVRSRPRFSTVQMRTPDRIPAVDVTIHATVQGSAGLEVQGVEKVETKLNFDRPTEISYHQRLYLLPGEWRITFTADGDRTTFPVTVRPLDPGDPIAAPEPSPSDEPGVPVVYRVNLTRDAQWISIGRQYLLARSFERAEICFRNALVIRRSPDALAGHGKALALSGNVDAAKADLLAALAQQPDHREALIAMGAVMAQLGDEGGAVDYYRRAQAIRPSFEIEEALRQLSRLSSKR